MAILNLLIHWVAKWSGNQEKWQKSAKNGGFEKKSGNLIKFKLKSVFVSLNLQNSLFPKPNAKIFLEIYKII